METIRELVLTMATENSSWGYTRICGALANMGHEVGRNTVKRILAEHGIEPAPARDKRTPWSTFLKAHWGAIAATDFFTVEVLTARGLIRYFVLFVIDLETRRVKIAGIVHQPYEDWMKQIARNLTDAIDGFLRATRFLIHDRDPLFSASFRATLSPAGVETMKLPARSPNLERNHQGLDNRLISEVPDSPGNEGSIQCRERLGGILPILLLGRSVSGATAFHGRRSKAPETRWRVLRDPVSDLSRRHRFKNRNEMAAENVPFPLIQAEQVSNLI